MGRILHASLSDSSFPPQPHPVVWRENQGPGTITTLLANDNDSERNGPPFRFEMAPEASDDIRSKFAISGATLKARTTFDREEKKVYIIPIAITDSGLPPMTGISNLTVIIGDVNDNPMEPGKSSIFVYNYKVRGSSTTGSIDTNYLKQQLGSTIL